MGDYQQERAFAKNRIRRRGIYLLPNLLTTAALFAGFWAIVQAMNGRFDWAAKAMFVAMVLDGLDGRVARLTKTQSAFGAEYDSLSDMVCFGAAPALVVYEWALRAMGTAWAGPWPSCTACSRRCAWRASTPTSRSRTSACSRACRAPRRRRWWPASCGSWTSKPSIPEGVRWWALAVTLFAGVTMVSNFKYYSFKTINLRRSVSFVAVLLIVLAFALVSYYPSVVLFAGFVLYALSGYAWWAWLGFKRRRAAPRA